MSTRTPILKLIWNPMPPHEPDHAFIFRLFTIQIGNQALVEKHWDHIRELLRARYDGATTNAEYEAIQMKAGDRLTYYDDGTIQVYKA